MEKNKKYLSFALIFCTLFGAFFSWLSVYRAITISDSSTWLVPMLWLSFYAVLLCLTIILLNPAFLLRIVLGVSFLFSIIFTFSFWHFLISIFCMLIAFIGIGSIKKDLKLNIKISLWKSLYVGKFSLILALAILISSQYFFTIKNIDGQKIVPNLDLSMVVEKILPSVLSSMLPDGGKMTPQQMELSQNLINKKVNDYFDPKINPNLQSPFLPLLLAVIVFLTILPLGSLLSGIWFGMAILLFKFLVGLGWVEIKKVQVEQELIV